jgi:Skp family chaperone for outer membrane proteins
MTKTKFAAAAFLMLAALPLCALAQQGAPAGTAAIPDGKVAVINTNRFPVEIGELKQKYDQVEGQFKDRSTRIEQLRQQLGAKENELQTKQATLTPERIRELQAEIEDLKRRGTRELEDLQQDYAKALDGTTKPVRDKLFQSMQAYAVQRGIVMIMDLPGLAQSGALAFWAPGVEITQDFIKEYNKANPVPGATAPPATQPAARPAGPTKPPAR